MPTTLDELKLESFNKVIRKYRGKKGAIIPLLQYAQDIFSYVPEQVIKKVAESSNNHISTIYGVVTFYKQFRLKPVGKHVIRVCQGTACYVNSAKEVYDAIKNKLGIEEGENSEDGLFTLQSVACLGCCSLAPVVMIDDETYGSLTAEKIEKILDEYIKREGEVK